MTQPAQPGLADRVRALLMAERTGALATHSLRHPGWPFASVMPYALDAGGSPLFLISGMAVHTKNLRADPRASLLVVEKGDGAGQLAAGRATLLGLARPEEAVDAVKAVYLKAHAEAEQWAGFADFTFFRLEVMDVYFVGGFGSMGWVDRDDYLRVMQTGG